METPNHNSDILFDEELYTVEWSDIENAEMDYENYLNDIENSLEKTSKKTFLKKMFFK